MRIRGIVSVLRRVMCMCVYVTTKRYKQCVGAASWAYGLFRTKPRVRVQDVRVFYDAEFQRRHQDFREWSLPD